MTAGQMRNAATGAVAQKLFGFRIRGKFASNAERTIQTKFESGALSLSRLIADWDAFTLRQNSSVFFQRDSFVDILIEEPKQTSVE